MTEEKHDLIERRARALARECQRILNYQDEADEIAAAGFRWAFLLLRRPKKYLEEFHHSDLRIDQSLLEEALWLHGDAVPGPRSLLPEELTILSEHNSEATMFMRQRSNTISLVQSQ